MAGPYRQRVPRPDAARPGARPPWCALEAAERESVPVARVRGAFAVPYVPGARSGARAAVLVPLYASAGQCVAILTRRAQSLARNPGDVAFPGGHIEPGEAPLTAALREAHEEIGLPPDLVEVIGELPVIERVGDGRHIAPYVGLLAERPVLRASTDEVEAILDVPLATLLADGAAWQERWPLGEHARTVAFFASDRHLGDDVVWGATAKIVWELLVRICAVPGRVPGAAR